MPLGIAGVQGIHPVTLVWTNGGARIPCDFRVYDKPCGGQSKHGHFREMLTGVQQRGGQTTPYVLCDSGYSSLTNLKHMCALDFPWLTRLRANRWVNADRTNNVSIRESWTSRS